MGNCKEALRLPIVGMWGCAGAGYRMMLVCWRCGSCDSTTVLQGTETMVGDGDIRC